jgi:hypothetical protein
MAALNFPLAPTDGQLYYANGLMFRYESDLSAWVAAGIYGGIAGGGSYWDTLYIDSTVTNLRAGGYTMQFWVPHDGSGTSRIEVGVESGPWLTLYGNNHTVYPGQAKLYAAHSSGSYCWLVLDPNAANTDAFKVGYGVGATKKVWTEYNLSTKAQFNAACTDGDFMFVGDGGSGDVVGPASAVDSNFAAFNTTTGKLIKDSGYSASSFATSGHNHTGVYEPVISAGTTGQYWRGDKSWQTLNSTAVGLGNVTNESKTTMFTSPAFTGTVTVDYTTGNGISGPTSGTWAQKIVMHTDAPEYNGLSVHTRWGGNDATIFEVAAGWNGSAAGYYPILTVGGTGTVTIKSRTAANVFSADTTAINLYPATVTLNSAIGTTFANVGGTGTYILLSNDNGSSLTLYGSTHSVYPGQAKLYANKSGGNYCWLFLDPNLANTDAFQVGYNAGATKKIWTEYNLSTKAQFNAACTDGDFSFTDHTHSYLPLTGGTLTGDITTHRNDTTGAIFLGNNAATRYLYYNGIYYELNGADCWVNGSKALTLANIGGSTVGSTTVVANLNADLLDGFHASQTITANHIVVRDSGGNISTGYINCSNGDDNNTASHYIHMISSDGYYRRKTLGNVRAEIVAGWWQSANIVELSADASKNCYSGIDLHGDSTYTDWSVRWLRHNTGADALTEFLTRGTGGLNIGVVEAGGIQLITSNTTRVLIASGGGVRIGANGSPPDGGLMVTVNGRIEAYAGTIYSYSIRDSTTGAGANMVVDGTGGQIQRSTSSARYKRDISALPYGLKDVMRMRPVTFKSKPGSLDGDRRFAGLIAEELDEIGLNDFVSYHKGKPDGIEYGHLTALLVKAVQDLSAEVERLKHPN